MALERFIVDGGHRIEGTIRPGGNKNAALPILAACLLTDAPVTLRNLPDIQDVRVMLQIIERLGASVERVDVNVVRIPARGHSCSEPDPDLSRKIRASILLAGPLLARCGAAQIVKPGGDAIGRRRVDTHLLALESLGAQIEVSANLYRMSVRALVGRKMFLDEASVTATENAILAAVLPAGDTLTIHGVESLHGGDFTIPSDHIEVGSYIGLAAVTRSELLIEDAVPHHMYAVRLMLEKLGVDIDVEGENIRVRRDQERRVRYDIGAAVPKIDDGPWPLFPADLLSIMVVVATQAEGTAMIFEKMFESRLFFTDKLIQMGARIILCDPHRAIIVGGNRLSGAEISSPDIRAGMALLLAALCAKGESPIHNIHQIDRGYERIEERLNPLGARIVREPDV